MILLLSQDPDWVKAIPELVRWMGLPGAILVIIIYSIHKGWLVPGWIYEDVKEQRDKAIEAMDQAEARTRVERDKFMDLVLRHEDTARKAVETTEAAVRKVGG